MKNAPNEISWWVDRTGSTHTHARHDDPAPEAIAVGKLYPESRSGVISHIHNRPANITLVSQQLLDVLHRRFPGIRWWIKDPVAAPQARPKAAS